MVAGLRCNDGSSSWCAIPIWQVSERDGLIPLFQEFVYFQLDLDDIYTFVSKILAISSFLTKQLVWLQVF